MLKSPKDYNAGKYKIVASNGVGEPTVASVSVFIYPILPTIVLETEKSIYKPESEATITCKIKVYPTTSVKWFKKVHRDPESEIISDGRRVTVDTYQETQMELVSRLVIHSVQETDTAVYSCHVGGVSQSVAISVQYGPGDRCLDEPAFPHCKLVVRNKLCSNKYYARFCCR